MSASEKNDALLLNSDTEVANDWLDRLRQAAYCDARVATVTPFSNNATICSYPRFCEPNELPAGWNTAQLDALFAQTNPGQVVDVPTGVGFCMYIRRDSLDEVGLFDVEQFGKGYGEENDFCRRAADAGWRNLHALDTFVLHTGGVSFGASKSQRERDAVEKLRKLHPSYDGLVHDFVAADPARGARLSTDVARVRALGKPCILSVVHNRGGGTHRHANELAEHLRGSAVFFSLVPAAGGAVWLELAEPRAGFRLEFAVPQQWPALLEALRALGIVHIHYHHVLGHSDEILRLGEQLGISWDFTAHDFYAMCPQISLTDRNDRYCGTEEGQPCGECPVPGDMDIEGWRRHYGQFVQQARHVLAPSRDTAQRFARMWPAADVHFVPHTDIDLKAGLPAPQVTAIGPGAALRIVVIGALSRIKGADVLEEAALDAARQKLPLEFHLLGYAYRSLQTQPRAHLTVHGAYEDQDLPKLLAWLKPDLVWFPALWPETYSYTLSACLQAGLPIVAPDLGAFPERLSGRKWAWIVPWNNTGEKFNRFFLDLRENNFLPGRAPQPVWDLVAATRQKEGPSWSYDADYLNGLHVESPAMLPQASLQSIHRPGHAEGLRPRFRQGLLSVLVRLRAAPPLRGIAQAVPQRWQAQVKTWLKS